MDNQYITISPSLFNRIELRSWIEWRPDGRHIGMGSRTEYDPSGKIVSHKVEPTGAVIIER